MAAQPAQLKCNSPRKLVQLDLKRGISSFGADRKKPPTQLGLRNHDGLLCIQAVRVTKNDRMSACRKNSFSYALL
jgi:hypothetical protein